MSRLDLDLAQALREIDALLATTPELADDAELRRDMIEGATSATDLIRKLVLMRAEAVAQEAAIAKVEDDLARRRTRYADRAAAMRSMIERLMDAADLSKLELPEGTLSFRQTPRSVVVIDPDRVPDAFIRTIRSPDKTAIRDAIDNGMTVPGATLSNGGRSLTIRMT